MKTIILFIILSISINLIGQERPVYNKGKIIFRPDSSILLLPMEAGKCLIISNENIDKFLDVMNKAKKILNYCVTNNIIIDEEKIIGKIDGQIKKNEYIVSILKHKKEHRNEMAFIVFTDIKTKIPHYLTFLYYDENTINITFEEERNQYLQKCIIYEKKKLIINDKIDEYLNNYEIDKDKIVDKRN